MSLTTIQAKDKAGNVVGPVAFETETGKWANADNTQATVLIYSPFSGQFGVQWTCGQGDVGGFFDTADMFDQIKALHEAGTITLAPNA